MGIVEALIKLGVPIEDLKKNLANIDGGDDWMLSFYEALHCEYNLHQYPSEYLFLSPYICLCSKYISSKYYLPSYKVMLNVIPSFLKLSINWLMLFLLQSP